jgi:hypothetical protein
MTKALVLTTATQSLKIKNVVEGSVIKTNFVDAQPAIIAVEIDNATEQRALVQESDRWMLDTNGKTLFTFDNRLLEYYA